MTDNILDICDLRHTHVNVCVYVSHIGSSTICCWPVMHRTMWAPVHIVAYSFSPSLWSAMQNFEPNISTADRLLCTLYLQHLTCTMQVRCGMPIYSAQAHGPTAGAQRSPPQSIVWASHVGKSFLTHTTNHTETARGGGVSHDGKITNL